jgi:hypothetical protein
MAYSWTLILVFCLVVSLQNGQKVELVFVPEADLAAAKAKGVTS